MSKSFSRFGKFSTITSLSTLSIPLFQLVLHTVLRFDLLIISEILDTIIMTFLLLLFQFCFLIIGSLMQYFIHLINTWYYFFCLAKSVYDTFPLCFLFDLLSFYFNFLLFYFNFLSDFSTKLLIFSIILLIFPLYCFVSSSRSILIHFSHLLLLSSLRSLIIFIGKLWDIHLAIYTFWCLWVCRVVILNFFLSRVLLCYKLCISGFG